jgi:drug/metabolite transporter (DMT)-like permease
MADLRSPPSRHPLALAAGNGDRRERIALAALLLGATAIAFAPIFVRLSDVGPVATAFWRMFLALPALWAWQAAVACRHPRMAWPRHTGDWAGLVAAGLFFAADLAVWHWSLRFTSVANATLLPNLAPLFVTLGSFLLFGERFTRLFLLGMGVAIAGAAILMGHSIQLSVANLLGDILGLVTAMFYAGYILSVGRLRRHLATATIMAVSGVVSCGALLLLALATEERLMPTTPEALARLAALAVFSHAGGQSLIAYALAHLPAAFSSVGLLLQPAVAALLAWALLNEPLGPLQGAGAVVILAGIVFARMGSR